MEGKTTKHYVSQYLDGCEGKGITDYTITIPLLLFYSPETGEKRHTAEEYER